MDAIAERQRPPADVEADPLVRAAAELRPLLRACRERMEQEQRIAPEVVRRMAEAGLYRMTLPRSLGGGGLDPETFFRAVEVLAEGAGSVGWNAVNNGVIQLITLGLPDAGVEEIYGGGRHTVVAGTAVPGGGQAVEAAGGYRVTGRWSFGSGCQEANWMLASFQILGDDGKPRRREADGGAFWRGVFRRDEVTVIPGSWDVTGLRGTGSFDWTVEDRFLPAHRIMAHAGAPLDNQWSRWPGTTYRLPVVCWIGPHHSAVITGIGRAGIDAFAELAADKQPRGRGGILRDYPQAQDAMGRADTMLDAGRAHRTGMLRELWHTAAAGREITLAQKARCRLASVFAADCARDAMDLAYRWGGSASFRRETRIAACWADLQVVGQTSTIGPEWYPIGGRALLGLDPGPRLS
jgi:alkylation response protein AidB-like acyl-CoA dehydrogenase